jgi:hypothetical protein
MITIEHIDTWGFEHAIRGMRNPLNSWDKSDSVIEDGGRFEIGNNDLELMKKLVKAGQSHRKFLRQIFVSMDIAAPLYWWKEFDAYKIGTVANSCSTMHTLHTRDLTLDDFSYEQLDPSMEENFENTIDDINTYRKFFAETGKKEYWWQIIQALPVSYNQKRTVTFSYENALNIIQQRENHKLDEWVIFTEVLKDELPYMSEMYKAVKGELSAEEKQKILMDGAKECLKGLIEYGELDAQARLLRLPCRIGSIVYYISYNDIKCAEVVEISNERIWAGIGCFDYEDIGEILFFTEQDAKNALEKRMCEE